MDKFHYFFRTSIGVNNFTTFGFIHLTLLIISLLGIMIILKIKRESKFFEISIGSILLVQQLTLYLWYFRGKYHFLQEGLPLFHCRIAIIMLIIGLVLKKDFMAKMGSYWGIFGSVSALLFPELDPFSFPHITQISYFIGHILLLWGSIYLLFVKKIGMNKSEFKKVLFITNIYHVLIFILNNRIHSNYGFMSTSPIGIGNNLNPFLYGFIVMTIFNIILSIEYITINRNQDKDLEECYDAEILNA
jgi:hypothetical integral membrane protein (TIGR02206 family)